VNLTNKNVFVTPFSYSRSMTSVCRDSRSVNEHSAYGFSTYGTRYRGSILAGTRLGAFDPHVFHGLTLTSVAAVHSIGLFADDYSTLERQDSTEHASIR